jgi:hypothetical protein
LLVDSTLGASFDGLARIDALQVPETTAAGESLEARLVWQPLVAHPEPQQVSLQLDDPAAGDGTLWGNGTLELYPAREWQPEEAVLSRLPLATEPTAMPQRYRLTLGIGPVRRGAPPAMATWQAARTDRVPVATVTLTPAASRVAQALPADMRRIEGPPLVGGGLELIGVRPLPAEAAIGSPLRVGLLWRATRDTPQATQFKMRLVRDNGEVVQEKVLPVLGGRVPPSTLHAGNVVRDEQTFFIGARVPSESLVVEAELLDEHAVSLVDPVVRLGSIRMTGRTHVFDDSAASEAVFGQAMQLLSHGLQLGQDDRVTVRLRWRSAAQVQQTYKVFVHLLDPGGTRVVAQRDAEPQDGKAPTTSWIVGEVIEDEYAIPLPDGLSPGDYPIEIGVYDPRSGDRLSLPNGDNRLLLTPPLRVR